MSNVWLKFFDKSGEPFRIKVKGDVVEDVKDKLLEDYIRKFSPKPVGTMDIQLSQNDVPVSSQALISSLQDTSVEPLIITNKTTIVEDIQEQLLNMDLGASSSSHAKIRHKKFTVNGSINSPQGLFYVKPDNTVLLNCIKEGAYIMLTGHRGSGKTSRCWYSINNELSEYITLCTTLQGVEAGTPDAFWQSYGAQIKRECKDTPLYWDKDITDSASFQEFFKHHHGKKIVLFIDEFDFLLAHEVVLVQLYDTLRGIKDKRTSQYGLQSLIAIGPHNISRYSKQELSPFNSTDHWEAPYFTKEQVEQLFKDLQTTYGIELGNDIIDSIYNITMGHPGMVCFCGKMIHEKLLLAKPSLSFDEWVAYETFHLRNDICSNWRTVDALTAKAKEERFASFLVLYMLSTSDSMPYDSENLLQLELIGLGALAKRGDRVEVSSPLVRAILLKSVTFKQQLTPNILPINDRLLLDVPALMRNISHFDATQMRNAPKVSAKKNATSTADVKVGVAVPHEDVYKIQLHQFLAVHLPPGFTKEAGMNAPHASRPDIVVGNRDDERVVVEVVSHERDGPEDRPGSVLEHIQRCNRLYSKIKGVQELWVVNFTTRPPDNSSECGYVWSKYANVNVIHVWHDLDWTRAKITRITGKGKKKKYVVVDLDLH